ncbi:hypothetical protein [Helicobacter sp. 23-1045]
MTILMWIATLTLLARNDGVIISQNPIMTIHSRFFTCQKLSKDFIDFVALQRFDKIIKCQICALKASP